MNRNSENGAKGPAEAGAGAAPPPAPEPRVIRYRPGGERPRLRPVEALRVNTPDGPRIMLRDPAGYAEQALVVSEDVLAVAAMMDGTRTVADIQAEIVRRSGGTLVYSDRILALARVLETHGYLEGPAFNALKERALMAYRAGPARPARHAGGAYPREPGELRAMLDGFFIHRDGPGAPPGPPGCGPALAALISPHIDLFRGGPTYAHAYKALAEAPAPDLFVIFGTAHASPNHLFTLTSLDYDTPLGPVPTDRALVDALVAQLGPGLLADELAHKNEHSIELQAVWLRHLAGPRPIRTLPVLTSSLYECADPARDDRVNRFLAALADALGGQRAMYIAAADLSHVGQNFGDERGPGEAELAELGARDRRTLDLAIEGDAEGFFQDVRRDAETRRICGLTPIYMALRASGARGGQLLQYAQWTDGASSVTYAAAALC